MDSASNRRVGKARRLGYPCVFYMGKLFGAAFFWLLFCCCRQKSDSPVGAKTHYHRYVTHGSRWKKSKPGHWIPAQKHTEMTRPGKTLGFIPQPKLHIKKRVTSRKCLRMTRSGYRPENMPEWRRSGTPAPCNLSTRPYIALNYQKIPTRSVCFA
jgi:hypothetical protein